jgi:hypothetical protein
VKVTTVLAELDGAMRHLDLGVTAHFDAAAFFGFDSDAFNLFSDVLHQFGHVFLVVFGADLVVSHGGMARHRGE